MARRSKKRDEAVGVLLILVFAIVLALVIIAVLTPIVFIVGYIYFRAKAATLKASLKGAPTDFWLSQQEKTAFKAKCEQLLEVESVINDAITRGERAGISRNADGQFSLRSNLGKEIRAILEDHDPVRKRLEAELRELSRAPSERWKVFNDVLVYERACLVGSFAWVVTLTWHATQLNKASISEVLTPYAALATNILRSETDKIPLADGDLGMVALATIMGIGATLLANYGFRNVGEKVSPRPGEVTPLNVDSH